MVEARALSLMVSHGIAIMTIAEMLILVGDNPGRVRSEAALVKLCGVCPIPASSGKRTDSGSIAVEIDRPTPLYVGSLLSE